MASYIDGMEVLARNAIVSVPGKIESLHHYRPRRGAVGRESAVVNIGSSGSYLRLIQIRDERKASMEVSRPWAKLRIAEREHRQYLDKALVDEAKTQATASWPRRFGQNAMVLLDHRETPAGRRVPVIVLREPDEVAVDGCLNATEFAVDEWSSFSIRASRQSWFQISNSSPANGVRHFLILTLTSQSRTLTIFHRSIRDEEIVLTDYILADGRSVRQISAIVDQTEWLEGEPSGGTEAETTDGETDDEDEESTGAPPDEKPDLADLPENHPLSVLSESIKVETLAQYDALGIKTVGDLARADAKDLASRTDRKITPVRSQVRAAENYIAAHAHGGE